MKIQLGSYELEFPDGAKLTVSEDGKVKVDFPVDPEVIEKIRVVEVPVPYETIRFVPQNTLTIVPSQPYQPWQPYQPSTPTCPWGPTWTYTGTTTVPNSTITLSGGLVDNAQTIGGAGGSAFGGLGSGSTTTSNTVTYMNGGILNSPQTNDGDASGCVAIN